MVETSCNKPATLGGRRRTKESILSCEWSRRPISAANKMIYTIQALATSSNQPISNLKMLRFTTCENTASTITANRAEINIRSILSITVTSLTRLPRLSYLDLSITNFFIYPLLFGGPAHLGRGHCHKRANITFPLRRPCPASPGAGCPRTHHTGKRWPLSGTRGRFR